MSLNKFFPTWPKELTGSDWNKQKGIIAKVVKGETGIGAELAKAEGAFDKIDRKPFHEMTMDLKSKPGIAAATKAAEDEIKGAVTAFQAEMTKLAKFLNDKAKPWESKTSPVPKATRVHVQTMATRALAFSRTVRDYGMDVISDIKDEGKKLP